MLVSIAPEQLAQLIDHTLLKPQATAAEIKKLCREAVEYGFYAVCVNPVYVPLAVEELGKSPVKVCTVIGFPLGATTTRQKQYETEEAIEQGAREVDMVIALGALKSGDWEKVKEDMAAVRKVSQGKALLKVILETGLLTEEEIGKACDLAREVGADFVKTSTGFLGGGATVQAVRLMSSLVAPKLGVKASGGIRTLDQALAMLEAGATRLGTSSGVAIMEELLEKKTT